MAPRLGYREDVQVLRGLAVLLVVLYHADAVAGGFVGVDVFFVVSGFVIGRVLLRGLQHEVRSGLPTFYFRRARRILPALAVTSTIVILLAPLLAPIGAVHRVGPTGMAAAVFSANIYLNATSDVGYFDAGAEFNPLLHTWSLSVEEQFYFVVPVLLLGAWAWGRRRWSPVRSAQLLVTVVLVGSLALSVLSTGDATAGGGSGPEWAFFSPFTRAWEFAAGVAIVLLPQRLLPNRRGRVAALVAGCALVGYAATSYSETTPFPGSAAILPVVGAALIVLAGTGERGGTRLSGPTRHLAPVRWVGDLSYSWYLWHWPFIVFAAALWPTAGRSVLLLAALVSLLPSWTSQRLVERRFVVPHPRRRLTLWLTVACVAAPFLAVALAEPLAAVVNDRVEMSGFAEHLDARNGCNSGEPLGTTDPAGCSWGDGGTSVVLVGDSHAGHFSEALVGATEAVPVRLQLSTFAGCPFSDVVLVDVGWFDEESRERCRAWMTETLDHLIADPASVVVIANSGAVWMGDSSVTVRDPTTGVESSGSGVATAFEDGLVRAIRRLEAEGSQVVLIETVPSPSTWRANQCSSLAMLTGSCVPEDFRVEEITDQSNAMEARAAARGEAELWSFRDQLCPDGYCVGTRSGQPVWKDAGHITVRTSNDFSPTVAEQLSDLDR